MSYLPTTLIMKKKDNKMYGENTHRYVTRTSYLYVCLCGGWLVGWFINVGQIDFRLTKYNL